MTSIAYSLTKNYTGIALKIFYRELKIQGRSNIPKDKPVIFAPNHQNSFLDAIIIACVVSRPIHYLVRASVFSSKLAKWALGLLNMMPIYRFRDGLKEVKKNDAVISACTKLLSKNKWLLIFPEGNHSLNYSIRTLQKGISRIAFQTIDKYGADVQVVPVGIYYEDHTAFRSRALVNFGKPINVKDYYHAYQKEATGGFNLLREELSGRMKPLTIHISPKERYEEIYTRWRKVRPVHPDISTQFQADTSIIESLKNGSEVSSKQRLKDSEIMRWALFLPYIYGVINHILPYKLMDLIMKKMVSDVHFFSSIKLAAGMVLVPICYLMQTGLLYLLKVEWYWLLIYLVTLLPCGLVAYHYHKEWIRPKGSSSL